MIDTIRKKWYIDNHELYAPLESEIRKLLVKNMKIEEWKPGETIFTNQSPITHLLIIKRGDVFLYHKADKKRIIFDTLTPGDITGALTPDAEKNTHFGQAGHAGTCFCTFPKELFWNIAQEKPHMLQTMNKYLFKKQNEYQNQFHNLQNKAHDIILHELERLKIQREKNFIGKFIDRPLRITHEELAERTGLNRVTVTRAMKTLKTTKQITVDPKTGIIELQKKEKETIM